MNLLAVIATALTVSQGQAVQLEYPLEPDVVAIAVSWNGNTVPFARGNTGWFTVIGVDLETAPGDYEARITVTTADGPTRTQTRIVEVESKVFPTTRLEVAPKYVDVSDANAARAAREADEIGDIYKQITPQAYWTEAFVVPLHGVTGGRNFGHRRIFNQQPRNPHSGADLKATTGTEVRAANRGQVMLAKNLFYSGNAVFIDHGLGVYSVYLHLSKIGVETGDIVERGEVIGLAGATGRVTGPHLHWGVRVSNARVDPFSLPGLSGRVVSAD